MKIKFLEIMKSLEMFEMKQSNLSSIYGGKRQKVETTCSTINSGNCSGSKTDGYYDTNGNGQYDCGETNWEHEEYICC